MSRFINLEYELSFKNKSLIKYFFILLAIFVLFHILNNNIYNQATTAKK